MKPKQLRTFIAVVESKSIHRGALALGVTQPAVSATIRELEMTYGGPLLVRSSRGVEVTELGGHLLQRGRALLAHMERLTAEMAHLKSAKASTISVAVSMMVASWGLPSALKKFRAEWPNVGVTISEIVEQSDLLDGLREGKFDFAVVHTPDCFVPLPDDIVELAGVSQPMVIGCREKHPLAKAASLVDLIDADWIFPVPCEGDAALAIRKVFAMSGLEVPLQPVHCNSWTVALDLFESLDFIGLFAESFADINFKRCGLVQVKIEETLPSLHVGVFQRKSHVQTESSAYFIDCFMDIFIELNPLSLVRRADSKNRHVEIC
jgi:LysR family transcriptional regulator, regulator of abg operon